MAKPEKLGDDGDAPIASTIQAVGGSPPAPVLGQLVIDPRGVVVAAGPIIWQFLQSTSRVGMPLGTNGDDLPSRLARVIRERREVVLEQLLSTDLDSMDDEFGIVSREGEVVVGCRIAVTRDGWICCVIQPTSTYRRFYRTSGETEGRLRQVQKMEALGQLAAGVAHDFNNLLTAIRGHVALARTTLPKDHPAAENLGHVEQAAAQAAGVVNALMTFGGSTAGRRRNVSMRSMVESASSMFRRALQPQIALACRVPPTGALMVVADPHLIQQAILNLLINARDAIVARVDEQRASGVPEAQTPWGTITLKVALVRAGGLPMVEVTVKDNGSGIAQEHLARIFEPFFTTKPLGKGSGLGLSIVHTIIQEHAGSLTVASKLGEGTTFTIRLPVASTIAVDPTEGRGVEGGRRWSGKALVVEPNQLVRGLVTSMLESFGFQVVEVASAAAVTRAIEDAEPLALLVVAGAMSDAEAPALIERIRNACGDVPCVVLASSAERPASLPTRVEIMAKPFGIDEIAGVLSRLCPSEAVLSEPKRATGVAGGAS
jgi:signal transduction histidine kinase/CheY-like chemotaxis protein